LSGRAGITIKDAQNRLDRLSLFRSVSELGFFTEIGKEPIGLESSKSNFVAKLGSIEGTLSSFIGDIFSLDPESPIVKVFDKLNPEAGGRKPIFLNIPDRVRKARIILEQLKSGDLSSLSDETNHDRLVKAAFNARHIDQGGRRGQFTFGSAGGTLGGTLSGLILNKNDPLLKDTSDWGKSRLSSYEATGYDIGSVADSIMPAEAIQIAKVEKNIASFGNTTGGFANAAISYLNMTAKTNSFGQKVALNNLLSGKHAFADASAGRVMGRTDFFGTGFFNSTGATGALQVARGSIKIDPIFTTRRANRDNNSNRLRNGGTRLVDEFGIPLFDMAEEGAVSGGFTSLSAFRANAREEFRRNGNSAAGFLANFGANKPLGSSSGTRNANISRAIAQAQETRSLFARTGQSVSGYQKRYFQPRGGNYGSYLNWSNNTANFARSEQARRDAIIAANQMSLKRAGQIDLLEGGFGLSGFFGSGAGTYQSLVDNVAQQDALIASIGLNRTDAFRIIDSSGRGRTEIDDRVRWVQRLDSISTGSSVL
jgi:hypothetical protein